MYDKPLAGLKYLSKQEYPKNFQTRYVQDRQHLLKQWDASGPRQIIIIIIIIELNLYITLSARLKGTLQ